MPRVELSPTFSPNFSPNWFGKEIIFFAVSGSSGFMPLRHQPFVGKRIEPAFRGKDHVNIFVSEQKMWIFNFIFSFPFKK